MENLAARDLEAGLKTPKQLHDTVKIEATADSLGNDLRLQKVAGVSVQVRNLSVKFDASKERPLTAMTTAKSRLWPGKREVAIKTIIDDISADMPIGSLTGVIGNSGSGKTTLLDVMSRRIPGSNLDITGSVTYNGKTGLVRTGTAGGSTSVAYVMQQDVLLPTLTVRETLQYAAGLRMPSPATSTERLQAVEDAIMELGLKNCANTRIGNSTHRGCSGGEKRRTSIGVQLLANQSVLFLDEPTTGLDATTAFQLVRTLKGLAMKGRTIIMTIHQPRSEIWGLLDYVVLLTRGSPVYSGPTAKCLPYFRDMGYGLPRFVNPGEFVIDLAAVDTRSQELESISVARVDDLKRAWKTKASEHFRNTAEQSAPDSLSKSGQIDPTPMRCLSSLMRETRVLTQRTWKVTCRDRLGVLAGIVEAVSMGVMSGWIFLNLGTDLAGIRSREGALYSAAALQGYLIMLFETYRLTVDIEVFDRERSEGVLSAAGFVFSRRFARFLLEDLPVPFLYSVLFYFMAGFRSNPGQFFHFFAVNLLLQYVAVNLATVCVALSRDFLRASLFANLSFTLQALGCGFFVNTQNLAIWLRWTKWTAHVVRMLQPA
jgi:ABC-type multidrug transport system ATPase subunit